MGVADWVGRIFFKKRILKINKIIGRESGDTTCKYFGPPLTCVGAT